MNETAMSTELIGTNRAAVIEAIKMERSRVQREFDAGIESVVEKSESATFVNEVREPPHGFFKSLDMHKYVPAIAVAALWLVFLLPWGLWYRSGISRTKELAKVNGELRTQREHASAHESQLIAAQTKLEEFKNAQGRVWSEAAVVQARESVKSTGEFYQKLANTLEKHSQENIRTTTLLKDLQEVERGCQNVRFYLVAHRDKFSPGDFDWLHENCLTWAEGFEQDLRELAENSERADRLATDAQSRITKIVAALRKRAEDQQFG